MCSVNDHSQQNGYGKPSKTFSFCETLLFASIYPAVGNPSPPWSSEDFCGGGRDPAVCFPAYSLGCRRSLQLWLRLGVVEVCACD